MSVNYPIRYPNLQGMMDLFRSLVNDDGGGMDGPQGGIIATNTAPFTLPFLNAAIRWVYRKLRSIGDPALILDNYILLGLPALAQPNPAVQVSLGFLGYFDGFQNHSQWTLPAGAMSIDRVWERVNGSGADFYPLQAAPDGLPPLQQSGVNRIYEWRGNALWMPGALQSVDLRLRCQIALPPILGDSLNFCTTYVPVLDSQDAIVDRMLVLYARRFSPDQLPAAALASQGVDGSGGSIGDLMLQTVRAAQRQENMRREFGRQAVGNFAQWNDDL
ncbi:MAG: hypothetical protein ACLGQX_02810 [Acidobacteriota bacterium]